MKFPALTSDVLEAHQVDSCIELMYQITGAKAGKFMGFIPHALVGYDTGAPLDQASIDALLGSSSEFVAATAFGATAMGTDALGLVLDLQGQAAYVASGYMEVVANIGGTCTVQVVQPQITALPNTLAAPARLQISSVGNVAAQIVVSGLDAATAGMLLIRLGLKLK